MILTLIPDLLMRSKVQGLTGGRPIRHAASRQQLIDLVSDISEHVVILDLDSAGNDAGPFIGKLVAKHVRVIGFYSHVHPSIAQMGRDAGCNVVMTRSQVASRLPALLDEVYAS